MIVRPAAPSSALRTTTGAPEAIPAALLPGSPPPWRASHLMAGAGGSRPRVECRHDGGRSPGRVLEHLLAEPLLDLGGEADHRRVGGIPRAGGLDELDLLHPTGTRGHDRHAVGELDRLVDAVGHEDESLPLP